VEFPEIDRAEFLDVTAARRKINSTQVVFIDELEKAVKGAG
jgi:predicted NUDIX family NTP pyrophosphohydrolase